MLFSVLVGIANVSIPSRSIRIMPTRQACRRKLTSQYAIYMSTIDYMVAAYGPYSASGTCF
jgi:hypothetical protein